EGHLVCGKSLFSEADEKEALQFTYVFQCSAGFTHRNPGGIENRISVNATTDRGERDGLHSVGAGQCKASAITRGEQIGLSALSSPPNWTDCVDDELRRQSVSFGD